MKIQSATRLPALILAISIIMTWAGPIWAQSELRQIGHLELAVGGLTASVYPANPTIPKNIASGVLVSVKAAGEEMNATAVREFLGGPFRVEGTLSGPGLRETVNVPEASGGSSTDALLLPLPALTVAGDYQLRNLRLVAQSGETLDLTPDAVTVKVIDQVLITSVQTRPLTLDEIQEKGIALEDSDYLGFQFDIGLQLSSGLTTISFPAVFNRNGDEVKLDLRTLGLDRQGVDIPELAFIQPMLLDVAGDDRDAAPELPGGGGAVNIPAVLVIPGNVGYLKQFFSAQLYVANGTPAGSGLTVSDITAKITLPPGVDAVAGTADDPLTLPDTVAGPQSDTLPILAAGLDSRQSVTTLGPGETGQAEFLLRGEKEGYHELAFAISGELAGLPTGKVRVSAETTGGVLVRNPYFDMTFLLPGVVRKDNEFDIYVSVYNISQALANDVRVTLNKARMAGVELLSDATQSIPTLRPGSAEMLKYRFRSLRTGKVTASYLRLDTEDGSTGQLQFSIGVDSRDVPLSPDTLSLPETVNYLPGDVFEAALRVLGEAWGVASASSGTLPAGVIGISRAAVTEKALALAEAGLRVKLGQTQAAVLLDLAWDFYGGAPVHNGFDQLLRESDAGRDFAAILGARLGEVAAGSGGILAYQRQVSSIMASNPDALLFTISDGAGGAPVTVTLSDRDGNVTGSAGIGGTGSEAADGQITGGVLFPLAASGTTGGSASAAPLLGLVSTFASPPYTLDLTVQATGSFDLALTAPRGDGNMLRVTAAGIPVTAGERLRMIVRATNYGSLELRADTAGDGSYATVIPLEQELIIPSGPAFLSATLFGPETMSGASEYGVNLLLLFDRIVDETTAAVAANVTLPSNRVLVTRRLLSGRLVMAQLEQPEGPYVPTTVRVRGMTDQRGAVMVGNEADNGATSVALRSLLEKAGVVVSGRVRNGDGTVPVGATVYYIPDPPDLINPLTDRIHPLAALTLDNDGVYEFRFVHGATRYMIDGGSYEGPYEIALRDPATGAWYRTQNVVRFAGEQMIIDFVFYGRGAVSGTVRDLEGQPAPGARVVAVSVTDPQSFGETVSDGDGRYTINDIDVGQVTVRAVKDTGLGMASGNIARAGATATVDVTLDGGTVAVAGVVRRLENGVTATVAKVPVIYYAAGTPVGWTLTADDGSYAMTGLPVGPYQIKSGFTYEDLAEMTGTAAAGDELRVDLTIVPKVYGTVRGRVLMPDGTPAAGVLVYIDINDASKAAYTAADGSFTLNRVDIMVGVTQGVGARTLDGKREGYTQVVVNSASQPVENVTITLSGLGAVEFTLLDVAGHPLSGQEVRLVTPRDPCGNAQRMETSGSDGKVTFDKLKVGSHSFKSFSVRAGYSDVVSSTVEVKDGLTTFAVMRFAGSGNVTGIVLNPDGTPALGAVVRLSSRMVEPLLCVADYGVTQSFTTGASGRFSFGYVPMGDVGVTTSHPFFATSVGARGTIKTNGETLDFTLRLEDKTTGVLSGTVYLPDGVTPVGAGVEVNADGPLPDVVVVTDAAGHYEFAPIFPQGTYKLTASDPNSGGVVREQVSLRAGQDFSKDLRLLGRGTVRVKVVDGDGDPVETASISLNGSDYPYESFAGELVAGDGGVATFRNVLEGDLNVTARDSFGRGGRAATVLPAGADVIDVTVRMTTTGTVRGHFLHTDGSAVSSGLVTLKVNGRILGRVMTPAADAVGGDTGAFSFDYVPAGPVSVAAQDPTSARTGYASGTIETDGQVLTLDVIEGNIGTVEGVVRGNGVAQPGVIVTIISGTFKAFATADDAGRYRVEGVPEGNVTASSSLGDGFLKGIVSGTLRGDGTVLTLDIALRASGAVNGQVLAHDGATPTSAGLVTIEVGGTGGGKVESVTDPSGRFAFERVPAGSATVTVTELGGLDRGRAAVTIPEDDSVEVTVTMNGTGAISGLALDSSGQPVSGTVRLEGTGAFPYNYTLMAGADGRFQLSEVLAGPVNARLKANVGGFTLYGTAAATVRPDEILDLRVQLQDSGTITGLVLRPDGVTPAAGAEVTLQLESNLSLKLQAQTDGRFTAVGVPLGAFTLRMHDTLLGGFGIVEEQVLNVSGEVVDVGTVILNDAELAVVSTDPVDGESGVALDRAIRVVFNNPLQYTSGISVSSGGRTLPLISTLSEDRKTITLTGTLPGDSELTLNISSAVTDRYGQSFNHPYVIHFRTVDLGGPKVASITPAHNAIQVSVTTPIIVTFNENLRDGLDVSLVVTLRMAQTGGDGLLFPGGGTQSGPREITFTPAAPLAENTIYHVTVQGAQDALGNVQPAPFTSTFKTTDTVAPQLFVNNPQANAFVNDATPQICAHFSDAISGIDVATAELRLDGVAVTPNSVNSSHICYTPQVALAEGEHTVNAQVSDVAGNMATVESGFTIDVTPPGPVTLPTLTPDQIISGSYEFAASASDDISGIARIELYSDGSRFRDLLPPDFTEVFSSTALRDGPRIITAKAYDKAGNAGAASDPIRIYIANVDLKLTFTTPAENARVTDSVLVALTANGTLVETSIELAGETVRFTEPPYSTIFDLTGLAEGAYTITAHATGITPGETATATRTIIVDRTAPTILDPSRITAEPPINGASAVHGSAGAVEGGATLRITHTTTGVVATTVATSTGAFAASIAAVAGDTLSIAAIDAAGNVSAPITITVRSTPSIPPQEGSTSLRYEGQAVDMVGLTAGAYEPDGALDGVFTLTLDIGEGISRTIDYIDLDDGSTTRSTRAGYGPLGVAIDPGLPLLNGADGTVAFPMFSGGTLSLITGNDGFIAEGKTYTVVTLFTDGARFVARYRITPAAEKTEVAYAATLTATPATTVVVTPEGPGETLLTLDNIRDIDGKLVPDGARIALSAANMASQNPIGNRFTSAGGIISGGTVAANNPDFQVFTVTGGKVTATYSSGAVTPSAVTGATAIVQAQAADAAGNVLGTKAIATLDLNIRKSTDRALVTVSATQLYADGADRRASFTVLLRDDAGNPVPDGAPILVAAADCASRTPHSYCIPSAGKIIGGQDAAAGSNYRLFFTEDGKVTGEYSSEGVITSARSVRSAAIQVLSSTDTGTITSSNAIGTAALSLTGLADAVVKVTPDAIPYVFPEAEYPQISIKQIRDMRAGLVPDGGKVLIAVADCASRDTSSYCVASAGGTILDGATSPDGAQYKVFTITDGLVTATYSIQNVSNDPVTDETRTVGIQLMMATDSGNTTSITAVKTTSLRLLGPANAVGLAQPAVLLGDGGLRVSTVTFNPVLDNYGNKYPDGAKMIATVADCGGRNASSYCIDSAGGQILNGDPSPSGANYKVITIQNGQAVVSYGSQGVTSTPGQIKIANVVLLPANAEGSLISYRAISVIPVQIAGLTSAVATANPGSILADNNYNRRSVITLTDIKDATGQLAPDGAQIAVSAKDCFARNASAYCISSAGGQIVGDVIPDWNSSARVFTITNGQVVFEYSTQGVSLSRDQGTANIQVLMITPQLTSISSYAVVIIPVQLVAPGSAVIEFAPPDLLTDGGDRRSRVTINNLLGADGKTAIPDGAKVGLTVADCGARNRSSHCISSVGGKLLSAGVSPGDGAVATNTNDFNIFTVSDGKIEAIYSINGITAVSNESKTVNLSVVPADINGNIIGSTSAATAALRLRGITYTTASGPETISKASGATATVTFSGIQDAAGNQVPDGVAVLASAASCAGRNQLSSCVYSIGGSIVDGASSPSGSSYKVFTVKDGAVTVTYAPPTGTTKGVARIQLLPAKPNGTIIGDKIMIGGEWPITVTD